MATSLGHTKAYQWTHCLGPGHSQSRALNLSPALHSLSLRHYTEEHRRQEEKMNWWVEDMEDIEKM